MNNILSIEPLPSNTPLRSTIKPTILDSPNISSMYSNTSFPNMNTNNNNNTTNTLNHQFQNDPMSPSHNNVVTLLEEINRLKAQVNSLIEENNKFRYT